MESRHIPSAAALIAMIALFAAAPALAAEPPKATEAPKATVADLSWLAGEWQGEIDGAFIDEQWGPPAGGAMLGMFRWVRKDGTVVVYELLALEPAAEGGVVLRLRHFRSGLVAWEDKEGALSFHLSSYRPGEAVFDNRDREKPIRLVYRKEGEELVAVLERVKDGKPASDVFRYRRR